MKHEPHRRSEQIFSITSASTSHSENIHSREKQYAISMAIRTLCFVGAVIADGWLRWVLVAGAVFLPYTSVILANAGVRRKAAGTELFDPKPRGELTEGQEPPNDQPAEHDD